MESGKSMRRLKARPVALMILGFFLGLGDFFKFVGLGDFLKF